MVNIFISGIISRIYLGIMAYMAGSYNLDSFLNSSLARETWRGVRVSASWYLPNRIPVHPLGAIEWKSGYLLPLGAGSLLLFSLTRSVNQDTCLFDLLYLNPSPCQGHGGDNFHCFIALTVADPERIFSTAVLWLLNIYHLAVTVQNHKRIMSTAVSY